MIFGNWLWPLRRRQLLSAASASLKIMASAVLLERHPLERTVRWRTVANELSMTFVARSCFQCSAGKSEKASSASPALIKHSIALAYLTPHVSTQTPKAASAYFLASAVQIACSARLALGGWLFGSLLRTLAVLCTLQGWPRLGPCLFDRLPESKRAIGDRELGANRQPTPLQIEEQFAPRLRTLAHTVGEADKLLPALGCGSDDDQQALRGVFETGLHVNAVNPEADVAFGGEIAPGPACMLLRPSLLEPGNGRARQPAGILAKQRR